MWEIKDGTKLIAQGDSVFEYEFGTHFLSKPEEALQYAVFNLPNGEIIDRHIHKTRLRTGIYPTHEFFLVMRGKLQVDFFNDKKVDMGSCLLVQGDFFCQYSGGHGFKVLSPGTLFIEVKHGPFVGVEADKEKF